MALTCIYGGEPKPGAPAELNITSGFLCGLFGATHPLCRLFDLAIPTGGVTKSLLGALYKSIKNLRYLVAAGRALAIGEQGQVNTIDFCAEYPQVEIEDITYLDVVAALAPFGGDELYRKVAEITVVRLWNENCQCKAQGNKNDGGDGLDPLPVPPEPTPGTLCYLADIQSRSFILDINRGRANVAKIIAQNPTETYTVISGDYIDEERYPDLLPNGRPNTFWRPFMGDQTPDANNCYCFQVVSHSILYRWDGDVRLDGVPVHDNVYGIPDQERRLIWCEPPTPPEIPDPVPVDDSPFLTDFCDIFPETQQCIQCAPPEHQEVDVPFNTACDQSGTITWGIDVVP
jgi:hypothetical protein